MTTETQKKLRLDEATLLPKYYQLTQALKGELINRKPGTRFYTVREIVENYGVCSFTANRALKALVQEDLVYSAQGKGTFVRARDGEKRKRSLKSLLLFLPHTIQDCIQTGNFYVGETLQGMMDEVQDHGNLMIVTIPRGTDETEFCVDRVKNSQADGVILLSLKNIKTLVSIVTKNRTPFVLVNVKTPGLEECNNVVADERTGVRRATEHLISLGHRRILFLASPQNPQEDDMFFRQGGFEDALDGAGISHDPQWIEPWPSPDVESLRTRFSDPASRPTAVIGQNDAFSLEMIALLIQWGIKVPQEVSVVGFDNNPKSKDGLPPLTTVDKPRYEMGREAVRYLLSIVDKGFGVYGGRRMETRLILRESCR